MRTPSKRLSSVWLLCFLLAPTVPASAYIPVPKTFHHWQLHAFGGLLEIAETEKLGDTDFRRVIVPGKQMWFYLQLPNGKGQGYEFPLSLMQTSLALALAGAAATLVKTRRRRR